MQLNFTSALPRSEAIHAAEEACAGSGLSILDARFYSDLSLSLAVEGPSEAWQKASQALVQAGFVPGSTGAGAGIAKAGSPLAGTLQVSFASGKGDLALPVPAVPG